MSNYTQTTYPAGTRLVLWHCRKCGCMVARLPHPQRPSTCGLCNKPTYLIGSER